MLITGNVDEERGKNVKNLIRDNGFHFIDCQQAQTDLNASALENMSLKEIADPQGSFSGMLMGKVKLEALSGSDIFVFPSYSENFGVAVVEAMVCGVPFVNSNRVGIFR